MRFPESFIQEILDRTEIDELVGRYVTLKRAGSNLVGLCPFHSEKTPSFSVSTAKRMFYCFGCHAGGSAITFVQRIENLDFTDAVEFLANRAGIPLPQSSELQNENSLSRRRVLEMNLEAAKFFRACLFDPRYGSEGLRYLKENRGLSDATLRHFGLGFAPNDFGLLTRHMTALGYTEEELIGACLCGKSQKTGRAYDYFRNRVMFPIIDPSGNVVAFGGRVMDDSKPKYLNSSDTPAFKKSRQLFALNFAKNSSAERMILCEGYMDVIALHAAGFPFAVATLGTAITQEHARIFSKYTKKVIISYDSDEAGQNAANKAMRILGEVGMEVRVLRLEGAKDPDEYIRRFGADRFRRMLEASRTGFEHKMEGVLARYDLGDASQKIRASGELCGIIATYSSSVEREVYLAAVAKALELPADALRSDVARILKRRMGEYRAREKREAEGMVKRFGDRVNPDAAKDPRAASAEESVLGLLLLYEEYRTAVEKGNVPLLREDFITEFHARVFDAVMRQHGEEGAFDVALLETAFAPDEAGRIRGMMVRREQLTQNGIEAFRSAVATLKEERTKKTLATGDIHSTLAFLRDKKRIHKGKVDTE